MTVEDIRMADEFDILVGYREGSNYMAMYGVINLNDHFECFNTCVNGKNRFYDLVGEHIEDANIDEYTDEEIEFANKCIEKVGGKEAILKLTKEAYVKYNEWTKDPEFTEDLKKMGKL